MHASTKNKPFLTHINNFLLCSCLSAEVCICCLELSISVRRFRSSSLPCSRSRIRVSTVCPVAESFGDYISKFSQFGDYIS